MGYRTRGRTGLEVSDVDLGLSAVGGDGWGPVEDKGTLSAMRAAFDAGVNVALTVRDPKRGEGLCES